MARTAKQNVEEVEVKNTDTELKDKLEQSEKEKTEMFSMIQELQKQIEELKNNKDNTQSQVTITQNKDLTRTVKVICMVNNLYNLSTKPLGGGKVFTFRKFGESKNIKFTDMQEILEIYKKDFEKGKAILGTKQDYEDLNIGYAYDGVLTKDQMDKLIALENDECVESIIGMDEDMQEKISFLIAERMSKGLPYDFNRIKRLEDEGIYIQEKSKQLEEKIDV